MIPSKTISPPEVKPGHHKSPIPASSQDRESVFDSLAERFGTPFYCYDAAVIDRQIEALSSVLPTEVCSQIFYSFKSNPNPIVAGRMNMGGCRADLTSVGEIEASKAAGFDLKEALYGGPGKSVEELVMALSAGIRHFSIESPSDLAALGEAAEIQEVQVKGLIRINPHQVPKAKLAMSGVASQFGFEEDFLREQGKKVFSGKSDRVDIVGVHIYWGTQIGDADALFSCFELTVQLAEELSEALEFPLEILNLGGGFPWPYSSAGEGPDLSPLKEKLAGLVASAGKASKAQWWFESGRFLSAASGTLVARVMDTKVSKAEKEFLILDTGIHHLGGMAGLGRIPKFSIDLEIPASRSDNEEMVVDVVGQLCTPLDCIGRRIRMPRVEAGDLVAIPNTGAYGATASVLGFLSRPAPAEILYQDGEVLAVSRLRGGHEVMS